MDQITPLKEWQSNPEYPFVVAGPCSAETEEQVLTAARELAQNRKISAFRAGIWKPRTRPNAFEGVGLQGLPWLKKVKEETGLPVSTEVANAKHTELALLAGVDILWVGARTTANPFSVQEIADVLKGVDIPVMVKNPVNADLALWIGALERLSNAGIKKLVAIHRGFSSHEKSVWRNPPMWRLPIELKRLYPQLPMICDPSHITGKRDLIYRVSQKALDLGMDGLMVETHPDPENAWSDADQQVTPARLAEILTELDLRIAELHNPGFEQDLEQLRAQIDRIDNEMLDVLHHRMQVVHQIGDLKIRNGVTAFQIGRMNEIMQKRTSAGEKLGLRSPYIEELFRTIHEESIKTQTDMMREHHGLD
ncbi:3-deoxy-7-phosphoheptulonate synthase [bacterium (Candidatus Blackallbacteria) CG17_big_fil_post_rev_8_21_14_2_50_48_46]|uniref:3-deoxy-7-phosphoheptulonate synthase n=1 Tax=bacterium (Candidatus Blackallbacteria) CG17_big_fil_post_rev_8_21_14_2_50_48_46 TaxID=2014261 RepID=A0A2M7G0A1_9BACT|nr:MAG: 3-deoxy-7-phosphoheptulonate synthase [bacterium (Candidatus Blackallbacteria) CG18_big_fil_WC_8_21_14_2_50_49_26]PIW15001.1 MAG: 3-deoxy-7-phosphoheptulonate synthase [bacterium (Candidatus Blackallbacteria) CG17_big_fil_post_rev_8_21_14_2_50_48_46]PIW50082.1 MAG: 3-deoxy-7-phosphoheptulonate synthase [bacterium (Candidatus Blackallbacteria) CG13_big_fil_rev_8_21_14_2_50_49_14]